VKPRRVVLGDEQQRHEHDRLGDDVDAERRVLGRRRGAVGDVAGEPAHDHEAPQHDQPRNAEHADGDEPGEAGHEQEGLTDEAVEVL